MTDRGDERMTRERLAQLIEAYGADPARWPESEREDALALISSSPQAAALRLRAAALDGLLDQASAHEPSPELKAEILARAAAPRWRAVSSTLWPFGPIWRPAAALALAAVLGLATGLVAPPPFVTDQASTAVYAEIDEWAFGPDLDPESLL